MLFPPEGMSGVILFCQQKSMMKYRIKQHTKHPTPASVEWAQQRMKPMKANMAVTTRNVLILSSQKNLEWLRYRCYGDIGNGLYSSCSFAADAFVMPFPFPAAAVGAKSGSVAQGAPPAAGHDYDFSPGHLLMNVRRRGRKSLRRQKKDCRSGKCCYFFHLFLL